MIIAPRKPRYSPSFHSGVVMIETIIGLLFLALIFVAVGIALEYTAKESFKKTLELNANIEPCSEAFNAAIGSDPLYIPCE